MSSSFLFFITNLIILLITNQSAKINKNLKNIDKYSFSLRQLDDSDVFLIGFDNYNYNTSQISFNTYLSCDEPEDNIKLPIIIETGSKSDSKDVNCIRNKRENDENVYLYYCNFSFSDKVVTIKFNDTGKYQISSLANSTMNSINEQIEPKLAKAKRMKILKNAEIINRASTSFEIRGNGLNSIDASKNIRLVVINNGVKRDLPCEGDLKKYKDDDQEYYSLTCKSFEVLNTNLSDTIGYFENNNSKILKIEFPEGINGTTIGTTISTQNYYYSKKKNSGMSTGGIIAIIIPSVLVLLGIIALVFFLRRETPNPLLKDTGNNNTIGVVGTASSQNVV